MRTIVLVEYWATFGGHFIFGTVYNNWFHKLLGMKVGKDVVLEGLISEVDLVDIGDNTIVEEGASVQPHTFENRLMQCNPITCKDISPSLSFFFFFPLPDPSLL